MTRKSGHPDTAALGAERTSGNCGVKGSATRRAHSGVCGRSASRKANRTSAAQSFTSGAVRSNWTSARSTNHERNAARSDSSASRTCAAAGEATVASSRPQSSRRRGTEVGVMRALIV